MAAQLKLFVFIIEFNTLFPVTIESSETVGNLRKSIVIKKPNQLKGVDANQLAVYQVNFSASGKKFTESSHQHVICCQCRYYSVT